MGKQAAYTGGGVLFLRKTFGPDATGQHVVQALAALPTSMCLALPSGFVLVGQASHSTPSIQQSLLSWPCNSWMGFSTTAAILL